MAIINSCCCWRSLRRGCYAAALYTLIYFVITILSTGLFIEEEQAYLSGEMAEPESESFLQPDKITPVTVALNIALLACSSLGLISCALLVLGIYKDLKFMLLPWIIVMGFKTLVEVANLLYLIYLQTTNFNPVTSFLFTMDIFVYSLNIYAYVCVVSQFQEYLDGRGTAAFDFDDRDLPVVQYTAAARNVTTPSVAGRRRSGRPMPSRCDPEEFSEAPRSMAGLGRPSSSRLGLEEFSEVPSKTKTSVLSKPSRSAVKKSVQFPKKQSTIDEAPEITVASEDSEKPEGRVITSLWMERESEAPAPER